MKKITILFFVLLVVEQVLAGSPFDRYNEHNIKPLAKRYRRLSDMIDQMLNGNNIDKACSVVIRRYFNKIKRLMMTTDVKLLNIPSILHMSMNRMFASQNRLNELVLYYCLERHYRKEVKRQKR